VEKGAVIYIKTPFFLEIYISPKVLKEDRLVALKNEDENKKREKIIKNIAKEVVIDRK
jgi:hypothetical protein